MLLDAKIYADKKNDADAIQSIERAKALILTAKENHQAPPPEYFSKSIEIINEIQASKISQNIAYHLFATRIALAEYRSSLEPAPHLPDQIENLQVTPGSVVTPSMVGGTAVYRITSSLRLPMHMHLRSAGAFINGSAIPNAEDILIPEKRSIAESDDSVEGLNFIGASQTLDGIAWKDVIFVGVHVKYLGNSLNLENVRFVNCVFDAPDDFRGSELLDYAALARTSLTVG